jgi:hypothetical protein
MTLLPFTPHHKPRSMTTEKKQKPNSLICSESAHENFLVIEHNTSLSASNVAE